MLNAIVELAGSPPPYRPFTRGIFPDGWTERDALLALPSDPAGTAILTLRFNPMPVARRLRLRAGRFAALGSFDLPPDRLDHEISVELRLEGGALSLEVLDAANLNAADARVHGVRLRAVGLRLADGREFPLFAVR